MKKMIHLLPLLFLLSACSRTEQKTTKLVIMRDITDSASVKPGAENILRFYDLKESGAIFRFTDISDVSYNRSSEAKLKQPENFWQSNEFKREEEVNQFKKEVKDILDSAQKESAGKNYSSVFIPVANELNRLVKSTATEKIIVICSDLMENQKEFSFYNKKTFSLLKTTPDSVKRMLEKQVCLNDLKGIKVYLVYRPASAETDELFKASSKFYKNLLESKGAQVEIRGDMPAKQ